MAIQYRIEDKENVHYSGKKTSFTIFAMEDGEDSYMHQGKFFARDWDRTDEQCIRHYCTEALESETA